MKITWIGQGGFLIKADGKTVLLDPYLSDSVEKINPLNYRRIPVDPTLLAIRPDIILLTHDHLDHTDPETLQHYLSVDSSVTVLASGNAWQHIRSFGGPKNNYVIFNRGTRWTEGNLIFRAVYAEHSDDCAVGIVLTFEGKTYYFTGDTLCNEQIFPELPREIDYVFLPINGVGNNMNMADGAYFVSRIHAKTALPVHIGLFDSIQGKNFPCENTLLLDIYREYEL